MSRYREPTREALELWAFIFRRLRKISIVETMKMQKLMYYCNAWSLADTGRPMFADDIQAWKHGPVVASMYPLHRGMPALDEWPHSQPGQYSEPDEQFINSVIDTYGGLTGWQLRCLTHKESPWLDAWERADHGNIRGVVIDPKEIGAFYQTRREAGSIA